MLTRISRGEMRVRDLAAYTRLHLGAVVCIGFGTDDVEQAYQASITRRLPVCGPPCDIASIYCMTRPAFTVLGMDGLRLEVVQNPQH